MRYGEAISLSRGRLLRRCAPRNDATVRVPSHANDRSNINAVNIIITQNKVLLQPVPYQHRRRQILDRDAGRFEQRDLILALAALGLAAAKLEQVTPAGS